MEYLLGISELIKSALYPLKYNKINILNKYPQECIELIDFGLEFIKYDGIDYITGKLKISIEDKFEHKIKLYNTLYHKQYIIFNDEEQFILDIILNIYKLKYNNIYKKYKYYHLNDLINNFTLYKKFLKPKKSIKKIIKLLKKFINMLIQIHIMKQMKKILMKNLII